MHLLWVQPLRDRACGVDVPLTTRVLEESSKNVQASPSVGKGLKGITGHTWKHDLMETAPGFPCATYSESWSSVTLPPQIVVREQG